MFHLKIGRSLTQFTKTFTTSATLITNEAQVGEVVEKFRDKYGAGQVKAYYPKPDVAVEVPLA